MIGGVNRDGTPLLKIVVSPAPGDDHRVGEEQGSLDGDQVPPIQVIGRLDTAQQNHHTHNLARMFEKRKGWMVPRRFGLQMYIKML